MPDIDLAYAFKLPPEKAIEYFRAKGYTIAWDWHETLAAAHAKAFTVAKAMSVDILEDIRGALDKALSEGITLQQFKKDLIPLLKAKGWWGEIVNEATGEIAYVTPRRLDTIYRTNLQTSYMAGRFRSLSANTAKRPWWMYVAVMDGRTRPSHRALHGSVFRFSDPIWSYIYPPNGYNCRCRVTALDQAELDGMTASGDARLQSTNGPNPTMQMVDVEHPLGNQQTVITTGVKGIGLDGGAVSMAPDAGWDYNPGRAEHQLDVAAWQKAKKAAPEIRRQMISAMAATDVRDEIFSYWVNEVVTVNRDLISQEATTRLGGKITTAGWLDNDILDWLTGKGVALESPLVTATDDAIFHAERTAKAAPVILDELRRLSVHLRTAEVYFDPSHNNLVFVSDAGEGMVNKFVVDLNRKLNRKFTVNEFVTSGKVPRGELKAYEKIRAS